MHAGQLESASRPGPGAFDPKYPETRAGVAIKSRYPEHAPADGPGLLFPQESTLKASPAYSMRTRLQGQKPDDVVGPGAYDHE